MIRISAVALCPLALLLQGCATAGLNYTPTGPVSSPAGCPSPASSEATVEPAGSFVYLNRQIIRSSCGLRQNDNVATGPSSTATIVFRDGATITVPENTDPDTRWTQSGGGKGVITVTLQTGWVWLQSSAKYSIDWISQIGSGLVYSKAAVHAEPGRTTAILFEGHMHIQRPIQADLAPMQAIDIDRTGAHVRAPTALELRQALRIFRQSFAVPPRDVRPPQTVVQPPASTPQKPPPPIRGRTPKNVVVPPPPTPG